VATMTTAVVMAVVTTMCALFRCLLVLDLCCRRLKHKAMRVVLVHERSRRHREALHLILGLRWGQNKTGSCGGYVAVSGNTVCSTTRTPAGGAIWLDSSTSIGTLEQVAFEENHVVGADMENTEDDALGLGGALFIDFRAHVGMILDSNFSKNGALSEGGAIFIGDSGTLECMLRTTFEANAAETGNSLMMPNGILNSKRCALVVDEDILSTAIVACPPRTTSTLPVFDFGTPSDILVFVALCLGGAGAVMAIIRYGLVCDKGGRNANHDAVAHPGSYKGLKEVECSGSLVTASEKSVIPQLCAS
jgi:hypothetical protein